jgi:hypothetical protein
MDSPIKTLSLVTKARDNIISMMKSRSMKENIYNIVACRPKARISESERKPIAQQRLGNHVSLSLSGWKLNTFTVYYPLECYHCAELHIDVVTVGLSVLYS